MRYVLGIDFDGVIHRYSQGDQGAMIYDRPTIGAVEALRKYMEVFDVHIVSARAASEEGIDAIRVWMRHYNFPDLPISNKKPPGELLVLLDDRAWLFDGTFPSVEALQCFEPWWKHNDADK